MKDKLNNISEMAQPDMTPQEFIKMFDSQAEFIPTSDGYLVKLTNYDANKLYIMVNSVFPTKLHAELVDGLVFKVTMKTFESFEVETLEDLAEIVDNILNKEVNIELYEDCIKVEAETESHIKILDESLVDFNVKKTNSTYIISF